jgi:malonate-semialdehyde dehydrogenase (acetylating)/methylmalonate-semialdehyde dehydrogenase
MATRTRAPTVRPISNYIGGEWVASSVTRSLPVEDPATGEVLRHVPLSTAADVDSAVGAARNAAQGHDAIEFYTDKRVVISRW